MKYKTVPTSKTPDEEKIFFDDELGSSLPYNLVQLVGPITTQVAASITEMLLSHDYKNGLSGNYQPIHMIINSSGGEVAAAWQICDVMDAISTPVYTIGTGMIASSALMVFINGDKGHRILSRRASIMSHQYSWGVEGSHSELVSAKDEFGNIYKRMVDHYHMNTGLPIEKIKSELLNNSDRWLTSTQAKKLKLADSVGKFSKKSPFTLIKELRPENQRKRLIQSMKELHGDEIMTEIDLDDE